MCHALCIERQYFGKILGKISRSQQQLSWGMVKTRPKVNICLACCEGREHEVETLRENKNTNDTWLFLKFPNGNQNVKGMTKLLRCIDDAQMKL